MPRVLLVDDEPDLLAPVARMLAHTLSAHVVAASSGAQGLQELASARFDAVVSDFRMPGMDGIAFLRACSEHWPMVPRILWTAYADPDLERRARDEARVDAFVSKGLSPTALTATLQGFLARAPP